MKKNSVLGAGLLCLFFTYCAPQEGQEAGDEGSNDYPKKKQETYDELKAHVNAMQDSLSKNYQTANDKQKDSLIEIARQFVFTSITKDFFPHWFGTPWDFNGCTKVPGEGKIACGFFVNAVMSDAGFDIPRTRWAQMASEPVIKILSSDLKRFSNKPVDKVKAYIKGREDGLYVVGLDNHVGYIYKSGCTVKFVHSSFYEPEKGVMAEEIDSENPLKYSKYRVIGKILDDDMMKKWITKTRIE
ncbi:MAG TPA: hypothetical protein VNZ49_12230 [Bacteroidia bacterium]|nr:hypothetical protein [Bacteroidia bacterium]